MNTVVTTAVDRQPPRSAHSARKTKTSGQTMAMQKQKAKTPMVESHLIANPVAIEIGSFINQQPNDTRKNDYNKIAATNGNYRLQPYDPKYDTEAYVKEVILKDTSHVVALKTQNASVKHQTALQSKAQNIIDKDKSEMFWNRIELPGKAAISDIGISKAHSPSAALFDIDTLTDDAAVVQRVMAEIARLPTNQAKAGHINNVKRMIDRSKIVARANEDNEYHDRSDEHRVSRIEDVVENDRENDAVRDEKKIAGEDFFDEAAQNLGVGVDFVNEEEEQGQEALPQMPGVKKVVNPPKKQQWNFDDIVMPGEEPDVIDYVPEPTPEPKSPSSNPVQKQTAKPTQQSKPQSKPPANQPSSKANNETKSKSNQWNFEDIRMPGDEPDIIDHTDTRQPSKPSSRASKPIVDRLPDDRPLPAAVDDHIDDDILDEDMNNDLDDKANDSAGEEIGLGDLGDAVGDHFANVKKERKEISIKIKDKEEISKKEEANRVKKEKAKKEKAELDKKEDIRKREQEFIFKKKEIDAKENTTRVSTKVPPASGKKELEKQKEDDLIKPEAMKFSYINNESFNDYDDDPDINSEIDPNFLKDYEFQYPDNEPSSKPKTESMVEPPVSVKSPEPSKPELDEAQSMLHEMSLKRSSIHKKYNSATATVEEKLKEFRHEEQALKQAWTNQKQAQEQALKDRERQIYQGIGQDGILGVRERIQLSCQRIDAIKSKVSADDIHRSIAVNTVQETIASRFRHKDEYVSVGQYGGVDDARKRMESMLNKAEQDFNKNWQPKVSEVVIDRKVTEASKSVKTSNIPSVSQRKPSKPALKPTGKSNSIKVDSEQEKKLPTYNISEDTKLLIRNNLIKSRQNENEAARHPWMDFD